MVAVRSGAGAGAQTVAMEGTGVDPGTGARAHGESECALRSVLVVPVVPEVPVVLAVVVAWLGTWVRSLGWAGLGIRVMGSGTGGGVGREGGGASSGSGNNGHVVLPRRVGTAGDRTDGGRASQERREPQDRSHPK